MTRFRTVLFWLHLAAGVFAGVVVLIMSVTGVALTYEKQMLEWADRQAWSAPPPDRSERLLPETLLARVRAAAPEAAPLTLTLRADPAAPATIVFEGIGARLVDPYSGHVIGPPPTALRSFFRVMTIWHRWLSLDGPSRAFGKSVTGAANLAFLFIVLSGMYLWAPRVWSRAQVWNVLWFRRDLTSKARDFNWHNVIGIWSAVPLAVVVAGAVPISYPWASALVYRIAGETPPAPAQRAPAQGPRGSEAGPESRGPALVDVSGLDAGFALATRRTPAWRVITVRLPQEPQPTLTYAIDEGYGGQPQYRGTLTVSKATAQVESWETFADQSAGRRLRSWFRFAHTGEYYGLAGQTVAGVVSAGGAVLVWTGLALAWRRFVSWRRRRSLPAMREAA